MTTKLMIDRFLSWPLPESLCSDPCASMPGYPHRTGTNLMTAEQAEAMIEYVIAAPAPVAEPASPWVAVSERLPQTKQILSEKCTLEGRELPTLYRSGEVIWYDGKRVSAGIVEWFHGKSPLSGVTHWMPLPPAPEVV